MGSKRVTTPLVYRDWGAGGGAGERSLEQTGMAVWEEGQEGDAGTSKKQQEQGARQVTAAASRLRIVVF